MSERVPAKVIRSHASWAIRHHRKGEHAFLLGRYSIAVPQALHYQGIVGLFETRAEARKWLGNLKRREAAREDGWRYYLDCKVVRVIVTVTER